MINQTELAIKEMTSLGILADNHVNNSGIIIDNLRGMRMKNL